MAEIEKLKRRCDVLEEQLAELTKRFEEYVARPAPFDPNRPIGPRPGVAPWEGTHNKLKESDEVIWPPSTRHL